MDDSAIICDADIKSYNEKINFNKKKPIFKIQNFYILLAFLLITIALLIAVSIWGAYIKYVGGWRAEEFTDFSKTFF